MAVEVVEEVGEFVGDTGVDAQFAVAVLAKAEEGEAAAVEMTEDEGALGGVPEVVVGGVAVGADHGGLGWFAGHAKA